MKQNQEFNDEISRDSAKNRYIVSTAIVSAAKEYLKTNYKNTYNEILNNAEIVFEKLINDNNVIKQLSSSLTFGIEKTKAAMEHNEFKDVAEKLINHKFMRFTENKIFVIEARRLLVFAVLALENNNNNWGANVSVKIANLTKNTKKNLQSVLTLCGLHETKANALATVNLQVFNMVPNLFQNVSNQQINLQNPLKTKELGRVGQKDQNKKLAISLVSAAKMMEYALESLCISLMRKNKKHVVRDLNKCFWMCSAFMRCGRGEDSGHDHIDSLMTLYGNSAIPDIPIIAANLQLESIDSISSLIDNKIFCHFRCFSKTTTQNKLNRDAVVKYALPNAAGIICPVRIFIVLFRVLMEVHQLKGSGKMYFKNTQGQPSSVFINSVESIIDDIVTTKNISLQNIGDSAAQLFKNTFNDAEDSVRLYMARNALAMETTKAAINVENIKKYFRHSNESKQIKAYNNNSKEFPHNNGPATEMEYALHSNKPIMDTIINNIKPPVTESMYMSNNENFVLLPESFQPVQVDKWPWISRMIKGCIFHNPRAVKLSKNDYQINNFHKDFIPRHDQILINTWTAVHFWNNPVNIKKRPLSCLSGNNAIRPTLPKVNGMDVNRFIFRDDMWKIVFDDAFNGIIENDDGVQEHIHAFNYFVDHGQCIGCDEKDKVVQCELCMSMTSFVCKKCKDKYGKFTGDWKNDDIQENECRWLCMKCM